MVGSPSSGLCWTLKIAFINCVSRSRSVLHKPSLGLQAEWLVHETVYWPHSFPLATLGGVRAVWHYISTSSCICMYMRAGKIYIHIYTRPREFPEITFCCMSCLALGYCGLCGFSSYFLRACSSLNLSWARVQHKHNISKSDAQNQTTTVG